VALGVNTWVGYIPSVAAAQRWVQTRTGTGGTAEGPGAAGPARDPAAPVEGRVTDAEHGYAYQVTIPSTSDDVPDSAAWVYLPPDYDAPGAGTRYPVVYALHGAPGTAADWFSGGMLDRTLDELISTGYMPPVVVVAPDLNAGSAAPVDSEPLDIPGGPQLERFVREDVVHWADTTLRTRPEAGQRVLAGMSAGGLAALVGALHHPEVFGGVISLMPYAGPYTDQVLADPGATADDTPRVLAGRGPQPSGQPVFLALGDSESPAAARAIERALRASGRPTTLRIYAGLNHNWVGARAMMPYGLVWAAGQMGWDDGGS
jgi:enterochelin esterase-like enzyme